MILAGQNDLINLTTLIISIIIVPAVKAIYALIKDKKNHTKESFEHIIKIFEYQNGEIITWLHDKPFFRFLAYQSIHSLVGLKLPFADFLITNQQKYFNDFVELTDLMRNGFIEIVVPPNENQKKPSSEANNNLQALPILALSKKGINLEKYFWLASIFLVILSILAIYIVILLQLTGITQLLFIVIVIAPTEFYILYHYSYYQNIQKLIKDKLLVTVNDSSPTSK